MLLSAGQPALVAQLAVTWGAVAAHVGRKVRGTLAAALSHHPVLSPAGGGGGGGITAAPPDPALAAELAVRQIIQG